MKYRLINHRISEYLTTNLEAVYEISADQECQYNSLPNGKIGLSVILTGKAWISENGSWVAVPEVCTYGLIRKPKLIRMSADCREISIGFSPPLFRTFLRNSMKEIAGTITDARCLFQASQVAALKNCIQNTAGDLQVMTAIEGFLKKHQHQDKDESALLAYRLFSQKEPGKVSALAADLKVPGRTLLNKFNNSIGLTPIELLKVLRINRALKLGLNSGQTLTELALELGYYDQAHFIHDFKNTLGLRPEQYFKNEQMVADFYNSGRWRLH